MNIYHIIVLFILCSSLTIEAKRRKKKTTTTTTTAKHTTITNPTTAPPNTTTSTTTPVPTTSRTTIYDLNYWDDTTWNVNRVTTHEPQDCGIDTLTDNEGNFTSPGHPGKYGNNQHCEWNITVDEGRVIILTISDIDIENHSNCTFDVLEVYDVSSTGEDLVASICGENIETRVIKSLGNKLRVIFETDKSARETGFRASYISEKIPKRKGLKCPKNWVTGPKLDYAAWRKDLWSESPENAELALKGSKKEFETSDDDVVLEFTPSKGNTGKKFIAKKFALVSKGAVKCNVFFVCDNGGLRDSGAKFRRNKMKLKSSCTAEKVKIRCSRHKKSKTMKIWNVFSNNCFEQ